MKYKFQYSNDIERLTLIQQHSDKRLVEEQNITEGNFLVFEDKQIEVPAPVVLLDRIKALEDQNLVLMDALATLYEDIVLGGVTGG